MVVSGWCGEDLLRNLVPQVLASVIRRYGDFHAAEDAVQEALLSATLQWAKNGVPDNPKGWLIHVACQRMKDHIRSEIARRQREMTVGQKEPLHVFVVPAIDLEPTEHEDDTLVLLFTCCHPALTRTSAIALTLRAIGGLSTAEIANAYMVPETTMAQRITRAKQLIRSSAIPFRLPTATERRERLSAVMHVLYLIFNEGYATSSTGASLQRADLCAEIIRLTRMLYSFVPDEPEVAGLLSLMLLTDARRDARVGPKGELIPLADQDRGRWDRSAVTEGVELITEAVANGAVGPYQLQAAIAALHDSALSTEATDWPQIAALYGLLEKMTDNPIVTLNRAVAMAMVHGPEVGLEMLKALEDDRRIAKNHRLAAAKAHLYEKAGDGERAAEYYIIAAERTRNIQERDYLIAQGLRCKRG